LKIAPVACRDSESVRDCARCDPEVVGADDVALLGELCPDFCVDTCDGLGDGDRSQTRQQMFDKRAAARASGTGRSMYAVKQFADGDNAGCAILLTDLLINWCRVRRGVAGGRGIGGRVARG
jgi:hypothetical protein